MTPPPSPPIRILLADDDPNVISFLSDTLRDQGFLIESAPGGKKALELLRSKNFDIVILDYEMPDMTGFEICRELRQDPATEHLPVIILSARNTRDVKVEGLNVGADDYLTKPVDQQELLARLRMIIRRTRQGLDANPLTRLPGNRSIQTRIEQSLAEKRPLAVLYLDLNHFKAYNDVYGFEAGDKVIQATAGVILAAVREIPNDKPFIGHIGGDDFIVMTTPERMEPLAQRIIRDFDALSPRFYNERDRAAGKIKAVDRQGNACEFKLLSIAIGICHNALRPLASYAEVSHLGSELKKHAKGREGSAYVIDRRRDAPESYRSHLSTGPA